jgi:hypothetical protein
MKATALKGQYSKMVFFIVWIKGIGKFFEFGPLITKVRHNLAHLALFPFHAFP